MYATRVSRHISAPRPVVYRALLDARAVARWRVPAGMTSQGLPDRVPVADNETGTRMALDNLATLVEGVGVEERT